MGYNTTINIINDGMDQLEKHPEEFVRGILEKYNDGGTVGVGNHVNMVEVMRTGHADEFRLYAVQGNSIVELSTYSMKTKELIERDSDHINNLLKRYIENARWNLDRLEEKLAE